MGLAKLAPKLALSFFALLVVFLLGELGLRAVERFERDRMQARRMDPLLAAAERSARLGNDQYNARFRLSTNTNLIVEMDPDDPRLNTDGLRDREYSVAKPAGVVRVLAVGDSLTYGHSVKAEDSYVKKLEAKLNEASEKPGYEVINLGVGGYNTHQEVEHFRQTGRKYDPDLVIVGYTLNDVLDTQTFLSNLNETSKQVDEPQGWGGSRLLGWIVERARQVNVFGDREAYFIPLYSDPEKWELVTASFRDLAAMSRADGFRVLVVIFPFLDGSLQNYPYAGIHDQVAKEAQLNGFDVLDLLGDFEDQDIDRVRLAPSDPVHPNEEGYAIIASGIFSHLVGDAFVEPSRAGAEQRGLLEP